MVKSCAFWLSCLWLSIAPTHTTSQLLWGSGNVGGERTEKLQGPKVVEDLDEPVSNHTAGSLHSGIHRSCVSYARLT